MRIAYLIIILFIRKLLVAQTYLPFPNDTATWIVNKYCSSPCNFSSDNQPAQVVQHGDSIKSGILYHKLYSVFSGTNSPIFHSFYRESAKRIYCKYPLGTIFGNDTTEFVLYDFNLNIGDTFTIKTPTAGLSQTPPTPKIRLKSITTTTLSNVSGVWTAYTFTNVTSGGSYPLNLYITWYQGLAANQGFLYNLAYLSWPILTPSSYPYSYNFKCFYKSNSFTYSPGCVVTSVRNLNIDDIQLKLYPNSASEILNIELTNYFEPSLQFQITNNLGQILKHNEILIEGNKILIDIHDLQNGLYLFHVKNVKGLQVSKRFTVNK